MKTDHEKIIAFLAFDGFQALDLIGPLDVFSGAQNILSKDSLQGYKTLVCAPTPRIRASNGLTMSPDHILGDPKLRALSIDTLIIGGGFNLTAALGDKVLLNWVREQAKVVRRLVSVCSGSLILAKAGLLDGREATSHWAVCPSFAKNYPQVKVNPAPIFIRSDSIYTSAGVTAGIDLALALIEEDHGRELSLNLARWFVVFLKRPGNQNQFSAQLEYQRAQSRPIADLQDWIHHHLSDDLSVEALAQRAHLSARHFARVFAKELGETPARYVESLRFEAAKNALIDSQSSIESIAQHCGFGASEKLRRCFQKHMQCSPSEYRQRFQKP
ncbi:MAG: GlxA family transcriptional regulator [Planctomycetota bacterium]|nr:GlxA family transcriptional regulator [Planctomycetota bacterium]